MNGPDHYREAERLLDIVEKIGPVLSFPATALQRDVNQIASDFERIIDRAPTVLTGGVDAHVGDLIAAAQVHATLALAAATAAEQATSYDGDETHARSRGWAGVA